MVKHCICRKISPTCRLVNEIVDDKSTTEIVDCGRYSVETSRDFTYVCLSGQARWTWTKLGPGSSHKHLKIQAEMARYNIIWLLRIRGSFGHFLEATRGWCWRYCKHAVHRNGSDVYAGFLWSPKASVPIWAVLVSLLYKKPTRTWDSERELLLRRHRTRTSK